jgi:hypothetical protein
MAKKTKPSSKQKHLLTVVGRKNINSFQDLADTTISDADLKVLRSIRWQDLDIKPKQLQMIQKAKSFVTQALSHRASHPNDYQHNNKARRCNHNIDHSKQTAQPGDFTETEALAFRGDAGQIRAEKKATNSSQVVDLVSQEQPTEKQTVAA